MHTICSNDIRGKASGEADEVAINVHLVNVINCAKTDLQLFVCLVFLDREMLAVPGIPIVSGISLVFPPAGDPYLLPLAVVEFEIGPANVVSQLELPLATQVNDKVGILPPPCLRRR